MKKKIIIPIIIVVLLVALFAPLSVVQYKDGGVVEYTSLTYKIVKRNKIEDDGNYRATDIYFFPDNFKALEELTKDSEDLEQTFLGVIREINGTNVIVEPFAEEELRRSSDRISFGISELEDIGAAVNSVVQVTYSGGVMETYPAQIIAKEWKLIEAVNDRQDSDEVFLAKKPVIYLYPKKETEVTVQLTLNGKLTCAYPKYEDLWRVTASPDGTLTDEEGKTYNYLYWEGEADVKYVFSKGFCVRGEDTAEFLEDALDKLGLTRREANEFIVYWLPLMQDNPYNIISFQTEAYTDTAKLNINPAPDTLIRVFMAYKPADEYMKIEKQVLTSPQRSGFTAVEWGGAEAK